MRALLMIISVFGVLTGCMAGVDRSPENAAELRAAVGRSALVLSETRVVTRDREAVAATLAARAMACLTEARMQDGALVARFGGLIVADLHDAADGTVVTVTRMAGADGGDAILAWAAGDTRPCPARG